MKWVLIGLSLVVGVCVTGYVFTAAAPVPPPDAVEFLPVENAPVFATMGANIWRIRFPAKLLADKQKFVLKITTAKRPVLDRLTGVPKTHSLLELPIGQKPGADRPVDLTVVIHRDNPSLSETKAFHFLLSTDQLAQKSAKGNPVPGCDEFGRPNQLGDFSKGVELATFSSSKTDDWVSYSLWVE